MACRFAGLPQAREQVETFLRTWWSYLCSLFVTRRTFGQVSLSALSSMSSLPPVHAARRSEHATLVETCINESTSAILVAPILPPFPRPDILGTSLTDHHQEETHKAGCIFTFPHGQGDYDSLPPLTLRARRYLLLQQCG
jgi:hypothetical protein